MSDKESADQEVDPQGFYRLRLFVAGSTVRSQRAIENLKKICDERLQGRIDLEIIDIYQQPDLAEKHQIIAAPTLVKLSPLPVRHIVGDLSDRAGVLHGLELTDLPEGRENGA